MQAIIDFLSGIGEGLQAAISYLGESQVGIVFVVAAMVYVALGRGMDDASYN